MSSSEWKTKAKEGDKILNFEETRCTSFSYFVSVARKGVGQDLNYLHAR